MTIKKLVEFVLKSMYVVVKKKLEQENKELKKEINRLNRKQNSIDVEYKVK